MLIIASIARFEFCPALVGLVGIGASGARGTLSAAWPLIVPLAQYIESVLGN